MLSGMTSEYGQGGQENIKKDLIFKSFRRARLLYDIKNNKKSNTKKLDSHELVAYCNNLILL